MITVAVLRADVDKQSSGEGKKGKQARVWDLSGNGIDVTSLDYSRVNGDDGPNPTEQEEDRKFIEEQVYCCEQILDSIWPFLQLR